MNGERPCRYCGGPVTAPAVEVDYCAHCFYDGTFFAEGFAALLAEVGRGAHIHHTGGGFFCLRLVDGDGAEVLASAGYGELPDTEDGPWTVVRYPEEGFEGVLVAEGLSREALVALLGGE